MSLFYDADSFGRRADDDICQLRQLRSQLANELKLETRQNTHTKHELDIEL